MQRAVKLRAHFIDTFFDPTNLNETRKFEEYTQNLMDFAQTVEPFECKDIKTALNELMEAQLAQKELMELLEEKEKQLAEQNNEVCFMWNFCFNPPQFGGFGGIMFVLGCILSILIVCCCQKWCLNTCHCCIPGNFGKNYICNKSPEDFS